MDRDRVLSAPALPVDTDRLRLRLFTKADAAWLFDLHSRPDVARFLPYDAWRADELDEKVAAKTRRTGLHEGSEGLNLAVVVRATGTLVGDVSLFWRSREHECGEVGFVFHPDHRGHGYATEATAAMLRIAFEDYRLHRVEARCDARNTASARVMERLGMCQEAHLRSNERFKGEWTDELIFGMLEDEWPQSPAARAR